MANKDASRPPSAVLESTFARRQGRSAGKNDGMAASVEQQGLLLLGWLKTDGGGARVRRCSDLRIVDGIAYGSGARIGALVAQ